LAWCRGARSADLAGAVSRSSSGGLGKHYDPETPLVLISSGNAAASEIAGVFYNADADTRSIGLVDPASDKLLWQGAKLSGDGNADAVASGTDLIYAANATDLLAYHKSDGSLAWQAQMPDKLNYGAATLLVTAGRVITNNADQTRWIIQISTKLRHIQLVPTTAPCCHALSASGDSWFKMFIARVNVAGWRQIGYTAIRNPAEEPLFNAALLRICVARGKPENRVPTHHPTAIGVQAAL